MNAGALIISCGALCFSIAAVILAYVRDERPKIVVVDPTLSSGYSSTGANVVVDMTRVEKPFAAPDPVPVPKAKARAKSSTTSTRAPVKKVAKKKAT